LPMLLALPTQQSRKVFEFIPAELRLNTGESLW